MGHFLDRLMYFSRAQEPFAEGHGEMRAEDRSWENGYRQRWQHDKIVRSTHGVNCTGSCSWKIYVKGGIVTWETQQTDYPRTRPDLPNHEPRGCSRGAIVLLVSVQRATGVKYPMVRGAPGASCGARRARRWHRWRPGRRSSRIRRKAKKYKSMRGLGGFVRATWDEVNEMIAAANVYTIKEYGPDRVDRLLADSGDVDGVAMPPARATCR